jgi:Fe-S oxidoreductase
MAGTLGESGLVDHDVHDVLDLCLECRACKAECPVGVDVARFKSEFLAGYWRRHGMPWRTRAIGHAHAVSKLGSRFAPLSNVVAQSSLGRWVNERLLGIDRRRMPPSFARETFARRFAKRINNPQSIRNPQPEIRNTPVLLFTDTFTNYNHPEVGVAAATVLDAAGIAVRLAPHGCCGRPLISQGLLDEARAAAQVNADALFDAAARGERIVFLEPSCLSAVREDAPALLRGDAQRKARVVADACVLFEDYVEQEWRAGRMPLQLRAGPSTVLLHGHCTEGHGPDVRPARSSAASRRAPWSISTRAAAAWPGRLGTCASITASRSRLASASCCPPPGPWRLTASSSPRACRDGSRSRTLLESRPSTLHSCSRRSSKLRIEDSEFGMRAWIPSDG